MRYPVLMTASPASRRYRCTDGEVEIDVQNAEQWHALAVCIGRPELAYGGAWDVVRTAPADGPTARVLEAMFSDELAGLWLKRLEANGVPCRVGTDG